MITKDKQTPRHHLSLCATHTHARSLTHTYTHSLLVFPFLSSLFSFTFFFFKNPSDSDYTLHTCSQCIVRIKKRKKVTEVMLCVWEKSICWRRDKKERGSSSVRNSSDFARERESEKERDMVGSGVSDRSKEAVGMMALHEALRSVCLNTDWTYSVFWTIRPRPYCFTTLSSSIFLDYTVSTKLDVSLLPWQFYLNLFLFFWKYRRSRGGNGCKVGDDNGSL